MSRLKNPRAIVVVITLAFVVCVQQSSTRAATRARTLADIVLRDATVRLSSGVDFTCQINEGGTVRCWGVNYAGQLGIGVEPSYVSTPVNVSGLTNVVAIAAGTTHACAVLATGRVSCWGSTSAGKLGSSFDSYTYSSLPRIVPNLANAVGVAAGANHTCALLASGGVRCWGDNQNGQLGNGTTSLGGPASVAVLNVANAVGISSASSYTCAVLANGTARCWGRNDQGQLGDGSTAPHSLATPVFGLTNAVSISAGGRHTCALLANGFARCWGNNEYGQLGNGGFLQQLKPVSVGISSVVAISAGTTHTCAVLATGIARCWGSNEVGQLGTGDHTSSLHPVDVAGLTNAVTISAGHEHSCALSSNGRVSCWGNDGDGGFPSPPGVGSFTTRAITAGAWHACAARASSAVVCWGLNASGQLGSTVVGSSAIPIGVTGLSTSLANAVALAAGAAHSCALLGNGVVRCWGDNANGQLGDDTTVPHAIPADVIELSSAIAIAAGAVHTCALLSSGTVKCWGGNSGGQLGNESFDPSRRPGSVSHLSNDVIAIAAGSLHTCALVATGAVRCWGDNARGQLGDPTVSSRTFADAVGGVANAVAIAAGNFHTCALLANGGARCWGEGRSGQIGDGFFERRFSSVPVNGLTRAVGIAAGGSHTCAVIADGTALCWGLNASGQIGDATFDPQPLPKPVLTTRTSTTLLRSVTQIAAAERHTCAVLATGAVQCWGDNLFGQLGNGTLTLTPIATSSPTLSFAVNIDPAATLHDSSRVATVTVLGICDEGQRLHATLTLTQEAVSGTGVAVGECTGGMARYEVHLAARGRTDFVAGPATAVATAVIRERGEVVSTQTWMRAVQLALP